MLKDLWVFYWGLFLRNSLPAWLAVNRDAETWHAYHRRFTKTYQKKVQLVKSLWFASGVIMLAFPYPPVMMGLFLLTLFLAFCILDETP